MFLLETPKGIYFYQKGIIPSMHQFQILNCKKKIPFGKGRCCKFALSKS